ncbi:MAG: hypothetical protein R3C24_16110 [Cyanobacteriota/Melainabacteria group bacterium]
MTRATTQDGHYRFATIKNDRIYFVCEDDIWTTSIDGGKAYRLTTGQGESSLPRVSPDAKQVAFVGREEGHPEVFVVDADGGPSRRLTYVGSDLLNVVGWSNDGRHIYFVSDHHAPFSERAMDLLSLLPADRPPVLNGVMSNLSTSLPTDEWYWAETIPTRLAGSVIEAVPGVISGSILMAMANSTV